MKLKRGSKRLIEWPSASGTVRTHKCVVFDVRPTEARVGIIGGPGSVWVSRGELREP